MIGSTEIAFFLQLEKDRSRGKTGVGGSKEIEKNNTRLLQLMHLRFAGSFRSPRMIFSFFSSSFSRLAIDMHSPSTLWKQSKPKNRHHQETDEKLNDTPTKLRNVRSLVIQRSKTTERRRKSEQKWPILSFSRSGLRTERIWAGRELLRKEDVGGEAPRWMGRINHNRTTGGHFR